MTSISNSHAVCSPGADDRFGPRVNPSCRTFDFTLQFEDVVFVAIPAAIFLAIVPWRLRVLSKTPAKRTSHLLLVWKLGLLFSLFGLHLLYLILGPRTKYSIYAASLGSAAVLAAGILSWMEDQRSVQPSDLLVFYLSVSGILSIPRLRSLWMVAPSVSAAKVIWTIIAVGTVAAVVLESWGKTGTLQARYQSVTKEQAVAFWSRSFFVWLLPFFQIGYSQILHLGDIPKVDIDLAEEIAWTQLESSWLRTSGRHRLVRAAFAANKWVFLSAVLPRLALSAFTLCQPFLIENVISYLATPEQMKEKESGHALIGAFVLLYLAIAVSRAIYWRQANRMLTRVRSGLIALIYRHTTTLRAAEVTDSAAVTLMGTDVERIVQSLRLVHEIWASIPEVAIAVWLLARQVSYAAFMPIIICLASVVGESVIGAYSGPAQSAWNERVQKRVAVTANMLGDMKAVKMLGLPNVLKGVIDDLRKAEIHTSEKFRRLLILDIVLSNSPSVIAPFATFVVYAIMSAVRGGESLLLVQAFTSLALISLVTNPMVTFCQAVPKCFQAAACFRRIENYRSREGLSTMRPGSSHSELEDEGTSLRILRPLNSQVSRRGHPLASFTSADISWGSDPVLRNLDFNINSGFTAIIGPVGSGKSTLLGTLIGETIVCRGSAVSDFSQAAFCSQTTWITDDTIRRNITGIDDADFDQKLYEFSIKACGLHGDLQSFPAGDQTRAGSNGSSLSGGQRQRVGLARAVYSRLSVVILDDVTSGLDANTVSTIATQLFGNHGYFRKAGRSVILATHSKRLLPYMDHVIVLENGLLVDQGSYNDIRLRKGELIESEDIADNIEQASAEQSFQEHRTGAASNREDEIQSSVDSTRLDLKRRQGSWSVYSYYARSAGAFAIFLWGTFTVIGAVSSNYTALWIEKWTQANHNEANSQQGLYLGIYALLVVLAAVGVAGECWVFMIKIISNTALGLHLQLLNATIAAPITFFQRTDTGTTTNRFSQDMDLIDMTLPMQAINFTSNTTFCLVQFVIICVLGKYLTAAVPVLATVLFVVQKYYLRSSRQVRLLDIEAKAPLYKHFIETIHGMPTIRSLQWHTAFHQKNREILDDAQRPFYMLLCIQQWLTLVLDLVVGALAVILVTLAISLAGSISPGALGVSLVLILQFSELLTSSLQAWTKLETSIGAVARVQEFVKKTPSEPAGTAIPPVEWPAKGAIQFDDVSVSYSPDDRNLALVHVSLHISPGEKIAICGSSGSGKTTLLSTVLRMTELRGGAVIIDGLDISGVAGSDVRSKINVIPQEPFFIPGPLRFNLNPQGVASDEAVEAAIQKVGLLGRVTGSGGFDAELVASEWSQGERQLLALARALLVDSKILVLDEATSSVDDKTETIMQDVIDTECRGKTVVAVLHRFAHIKRFDRVAVLDHGRLVECDTPQALLERPSLFRDLYRAYNTGF